MSESPLLKYFQHSYLTPRIQDISRTMRDLAETMDNTLPDGTEKEAGIRKLLEAKDCFIRASLES